MTPKPALQTRYRRFRCVFGALALLGSLLLPGLGQAQNNPSATASNSAISQNNDIAQSGTIVRSHAIALHDKPRYDASFSGFDYTDPNAKKGGTLKRASFGSFDSFNLFITRGVPDTNVALIYDTLMVASADEVNTLYGLVAETLEYPESRDWVIFHINPRARFHDGKPVRAQDIAFSYRTLLESGAPQYKVIYQDVAGVEVLDTQRIKFTIKSPVNREAIMILGGLPVLPEHAWQGKAFDKPSLEIPLGSGPYRLTQFEGDKFVKFERVADYWGQHLAVNRGMNNFDVLQFDYYRDMDVMLEAFKAGKYDFHYEYMAKSWANAYKIPAVTSGRIQKIELPDQQIRPTQAVFMNLRKPAFQNPALREALSLAFDFEWSNKALFHNAYIRSHNYFLNSELGATGKPEGLEREMLLPYQNQLPAEVFGEAYRAPSTDGSGVARENLRRAKNLLTQAGYTLVNNQLIDPKTQKPLQFEFIDSQQGLERIFNPWIENVKRLGIQISYRTIDSAQYINRLQKFDYDLTMLALPQSNSPSVEQVAYWGSASADIEGSSNYSGLKNPVIDALTQKITQASTRDQLIAACRALDRVIMHLHLTIPMYYHQHHRIAYWDKFERPATTPKFDPRYRVGVSTWWYSPEKAKQLDQAAAAPASAAKAP
jgi:microcin C transport system substrate-binding protein